MKLFKIACLFHSLFGEGERKKNNPQENKPLLDVVNVISSKFLNDL